MIWIIGCNGMLGKEIFQLLEDKKFPCIGTDIEVDITNYESLFDFTVDKNIKWIINCAAYTAVDKAESEEDFAYKLNADGPYNIAKVAKHIGAGFIHFSTDYVFDGKADTPYCETDQVSPESVYGSTKLEGERKIASVLNDYFIFRISWLYGAHGPNFVKTMLRLFSERDKLGVVGDQIGAPTYSKELAENIVDFISSENNQKYGIYHYSDDGQISWYDFACKVREIALGIGKHKSDVKINSITTDMYPTPAKRPAWSVFDKTKVKSELNFQVKNWEENLREYMEENG